MANNPNDNVMTRVLAVAFGLLIAFAGTAAQALGLGEITLKSALNQKLDAEIELLDAKGMDSSEIIAQLASSDDFARVGVERFFFLTELRFKVEARGDGHVVLKVTSAQPITEPFVNFLVQVMWPSGRLLKEYTLLLDPPAFTERAAAPVAAPTRADPGGGSAGRVERTPTRPDSVVSMSSPVSPPHTSSPRSSPPERLGDGTYGMTDRDDTLWAIAMKARRGDATVQQTMLAITKLNPQAFIGGNINLLKAGYVLRLPDEADAKALDRDAAVAAVAEHNQAWQAYRNGGSAAVAQAPSSTGAEAPMAAQVDATRRPHAAAPHALGPDGELRIVAGDSTQTGGSAAGGGKGDEALAEKLAASAEEVDRVGRERDEAVASASRVEAEKQEAQRQIEVKDQQIAALQQQLKDASTKAKPAEAAPPTRAADAKASGLMALLGSPLVLGGAGLVIVLLIVAALASMRRRRAAALNADVPLFESRTRRQPVRAAALVEHVDDDDAVADAPEHVAEETAVAPREHEEHETHEGAQTSDVIGEADIYIAYGRYPQAVNLLLGALEEDPSRSDVRLKLLEVYADTKDSDGFGHQMQLLQQHCEDNGMLLEARELEAKLRDAEPAGAPAQPAPTASAASTATTPSEEFDLDLDDDDVRPHTPPPPAARSAAAGRGSDDLGGDLGIDFDPDAPARSATLSRAAKVLRKAAPEADVAVEDGEPEFDLEDLELDETRAAAPAREPKASDANADDAFDFLDEEDTASTKLDLARAYIDMGDDDGAREILAEVVQEGSVEQRKQADELLAKLS